MHKSGGDSDARFPTVWKIQCFNPRGKLQFKASSGKMICLEKKASNL
jgi:hypothetical protein